MTGQAFTVQNKETHKTQNPIPASLFIYLFKTTPQTHNKPC